MSNKKLLEPFYNTSKEIIEIGIDEAGRGPMFGRVYAACVVFSKDLDLNYSNIKDSKKFTSKKKLNEAYEWVKKNALYYSVNYEDEKTIDKINIRQATLKAMHKCIDDVVNYNNLVKDNCSILVDGNDFKPYLYWDDNMLIQIPHTCIKGGDNLYVSIAAASILAKVERDKYISELCEENNYLIDNYDILNNKGYGTKKHMEGINKHGITQWHRTSYGICKNYVT